MEGLENIPRLTGAMALLAWFFIYWEGGIELARAQYHAWKEMRTPWDAPLLAVLTLFSGGIIATSLWMAVSQPPGLLPRTAEIPGLVLLGLGIAGMFTARRYLGSAWRAETRIQAAQNKKQGKKEPEFQIVMDGPYALVRHPIYTCAMVSFLGAGLLFSAWWNVLLVGGVVVLYTLKTADEDAYLINTLPGYRGYSLRVTYRLLPGIW